jgi:ribosomal protein S6E (S10)
MPNQPEMVRLRTELTGKGSTAQADYENSMMRRMVEKQLGKRVDGSMPAAGTQTANGETEATGDE